MRKRTSRGKTTVAPEMWVLSAPRHSRTRQKTHELEREGKHWRSKKGKYDRHMPPPDSLMRVRWAKAAAAPAGDPLNKNGTGEQLT